MLRARSDKMRSGRINHLSKEQLRDIFRKFGVDEPKGDLAMKGNSGVQLISISELKPHPRNAEIYGDEDVSDLVVQIEAYGGIADPLKVKEDYTIISGHRRWQAARNLGMAEVPCQIVSYDSEEEELAALVMLNYHRAKTNEQKAREGMVLEEALKAEGMERKIRALKQNQPDRDPGSTTVVSEETDDPSGDADVSGKKGRTRDIVADAVNIGSGKNFDRMKKVVVAADKLKADGKPDDAAFLLQMLDKSVKPASNLLDAGFLALSDEEREHIRNGEMPVKQFIDRQSSKSKSKMSFKQIMKGLSAAEQVISGAAQTVDALSEDEAIELMKNLDSIKSALASVTSRLKRKGLPN